MHGFCAVACQHGEVVHFACAARLHHQTSCGAQAFAYQVLVNGRQGQHSRNSHLGGAHSAVADDEDVVTAFDGIHRLSAQRCQLGFDAVVAPCQGVSHVERGAFELAVCVLFDVTQLGHVGEVQHRLADFQTHGWVDLVDIKQVGLRAHERHQRHDDGFTDRVNRWVGHLREQLLEVVVQRLVFARQHSQWAVVAHRANALFAVDGHGGHQELDVFLAVAKRLLTIEQGHIAGLGSFAFVAFDVVELDADVFNPLLIGLVVGQARFEFFVVDHATLLEVDQEHLAGLQTPLAHDLALRHGQHA